MTYCVLILLGLTLSLTLGLTLGVNVFNATEGEVFRYVFWGLILLVIVDVIGAILPRILPKKWFNPFSKVYKVFKWERKLYIALGIRHWKVFVPEAGEHLNGFAKSKLASSTDNDYIYKFLEETVKGEVGHVIGALFSFVVVLLNKKLFISVGICLMIFNFILNWLPVMIQRYNRPKLMALYIRNNRRQNNLTI